MLAAPREKTRYIVQPRGKPIYDDQKSFGLKMLTKMGWSKEKGLGAHEDGQKEFITLRYKNDSGGMGYQEKDNQWTENETQFDSLLKSLNQTDKEKEEAERTTESLEAKSKGSRARVHYKKFTRGKDTSRYSAKDLANIFGKKTLDEEEELVKKEQSGSDDGEEEQQQKKGLKHGVETYEATLSSVDYFKDKLTKFFGKKGDSPAESPEDTGDDQEQVKKSKSKKSKKRRAEEEVESTPVPEEEGPPKKKKKKKEEHESVKQEKKSKKKSKKIETIEIQDNSMDEETVKDLNASTEGNNEDAQPKTKKEKRPKLVEEEDEQQVIIDMTMEEEQKQEKKSKKKKKKSKSQNTSDPVQISETISLLDDSVAEVQQEEEPPKKEKTKKSKNGN